MPNPGESQTIQPPSALQYQSNNLSLSSLATVMCESRLAARHNHILFYLNVRADTALFTATVLLQDRIIAAFSRSSTVLPVAMIGLETPTLQFQVEHVLLMSHPNCA